MLNSRIDAGEQIVLSIGKSSFKEIVNNLDSVFIHSPHLISSLCWQSTIVALPSRINSTYINQSSYWLTYFPYITSFDVHCFNVINICRFTACVASSLCSILRNYSTWHGHLSGHGTTSSDFISYHDWPSHRLFGRTPRDIREWTQPADFEYAVY